MTLTQIAKMTEDEARAYIESIFWPNGPVCPHCGSVEVSRLNGDSPRPGTFYCRGCHEQFTVTVGTVIESSHIPLSKWVLAFHLMCSSKKGISSLQLQRELDLGCYRTALFMTHRIREAMSDTVRQALKGTVEADETYVGGKPRKGNGKEHKRGRGTSKTPVAVVVERDGQSEAEVVARVDGVTLKGFIRENVDPSAAIITDEMGAYYGIGKHFAGGHQTVNHGQDEYVRYAAEQAIHTNTAESFFSLLKRGHYGVYHQMSKQHLHRYCDEFSFRWDHRRVSDGQRTVAAIEGAAGKRLMYKQMVGR